MHHAFSLTGLPNGGTAVQNKNNRPVTAKGEFLKTGEGQQTGNNNKLQDNMELTEYNEPERGHTPSPTKTHSSVITAGGINAELQSSNTLNGVSATKFAGDPELGDEEEDEDAFHDDLPDIGPRHQKYLIQKYATLWFNKIKPGENIDFKTYTSIGKSLKHCIFSSGYMIIPNTWYQALSS